MKPTIFLPNFAHQRRTILGRVVIVSAAIGALATSVSALDWDINAATPGIQGGSGTWSTSAANWNGTPNVVWSNGNTAVFGGVTDDAPGTYIVDVDSAITLANGSALAFNNSGYILSSDEARTITMGTSGTHGVNVASGKTATIGNNVTLSSSYNATFNLYGAGTLVIGNGGKIEVSGTQNFTYGIGTLEVAAGGTVNATTKVMYVGHNSSNFTSNGTLNITGGTMNTGSLTLGNNGNPTSAAVNSTLSITAGALNAGNTTTGIKMGTSADYVGSASNISATMHLNGGIVTTAGIYEMADAGNYITTTLNFNGGTLKTITDSTLSGDFVKGITTAQVRNGGAIFDTNGVATTVGQSLIHSGIGGDNAIDGGLSKQGAGTLTLTAANTYTGKTTITDGTLALGSTGSIANSNEIALNGGNFNVSAVSGFALGPAQSLTGSGSVTGAITVNGNLAIGDSPGTVTFNNDLTLGASSVSDFEFTTGAFTVGTYDLAQGGIGSQQVNFDGTLNLFFTGSGYTHNSTVQIFNFETYSGNFDTFTFDGLGVGNSASFDQTTGIVTLSIIPEPGAALLGSLGLLALLRRRRA